MFIVRPMGAEDLSGVIYLANQALSETYTSDFFVQLVLLASDHFFVAESPGVGIIGFTAGIRNDCRCGRILFLAVDEGFRGRGLGNALLKQLITSLAKRNVNRVTLEVRTENGNAQEFYMKRGFSIKRALTEFYNDGSDAYEMEMFL